MNQQSIDDAVKQRFLDLHQWAKNMEEQLRQNYETQQIWPMGYPGPYPYYQYENAKKRSSGRSDVWVSTGESFRSIYSQVYNGAGGSTERIQFFFRYYLMFADMGVGKGTHYGNVDNSQKAHWGRLYKKWGTPRFTSGGQMVSNGQTRRRSRPHLMMEFRHQLTRLEFMVTEYYSRLGEENLYRWLYSIETNTDISM